MTSPVQGATSAAALQAGSLDATSGTTASVELAMELAPSGAERRGAAAPVGRDQRIAEDAVVARRAADALAVFTDPDAVFRMLQLASRDMQSEVRHEGVESQHQIADVAQQQRAAMIAQSREDAQQADFWADVANVVGKIAAVVGAVASLAASWCTGGATVVLAVDLFLAAFGPMICEGLGEAGVLPDDVALGIGIGCTVVGSALSFGAGAAGAAGSVASQAVKIAADAAQYTASALQTAQGTMQIGSAVEGGDSQHRIVDSEAAGFRAESALGAAEDETNELAATFRLFARIGEQMRRISESRGELLRAAVGARA